MPENLYQRRAGEILSWILASLLVLVCLWVGRLTGAVEAQQEDIIELRTVYSEAYAWIVVTRVEAAKFGLDLPPPPPRLATEENRP